GGHGLGVGVRGEEGRDQEPLVEALLRGEQRLDGRRLRRPRDRSRGAQRPEGGSVQVRGLQGLTERQSVGRRGVGGAGGGEELGRSSSPGAGQRAEQSEQGKAPAHSSTPNPRYTPTTCSVSEPPSVTLECATARSLLLS